MQKVLKKTRKGKPRVQNQPKPASSEDISESQSGHIFSGIKTLKSKIQRLGRTKTEETETLVSDTSRESGFRLTLPKLKLPLKLGRDKGEEPRSKLSRKEKKAKKYEPLLAFEDDNEEV